MTSDPELLREHQAAEQTASYWRVFGEECKRDPNRYFSTLRQKLTALSTDYSTDPTRIFKGGKLSEFTEVQVRVAIQANPARASELLHQQMALVQPTALDITLEKRAHFRVFITALKPLVEEADREKLRRETRLKAELSGSGEA